MEVSATKCCCYIVCLDRNETELVQPVTVSPLLHNNLSSGTGTLGSFGVLVPKDCVSTHCIADITGRSTRGLILMT